MQAAIKLQNLEKEFFTEEKCFITEISNCVQDDPTVSIARARLEPGVTTRWHRLINTVERYSIIQGQGLVEIGHLESQEVNPGDVVLIPAMCRQRITNIGSGDLIFLAICTPPFKNENYQDIENEPEQN